MDYFVAKTDTCASDLKKYLKNICHITCKEVQLREGRVVTMLFLCFRLVPDYESTDLVNSSHETLIKTTTLSVCEVDPQASVWR